jgi:tRNA A-37 threonylcarbamoyl transferase component Bud32
MANNNVDRVGEQIGPYYLTRLLGAGGFGEVYEAQHRLIQQKRAIKLLLERHFHDPKQRERFLREARTLAALDHDNILRVLEVDEAGTILYLVMPLYQRGTLNDLLKQRATPLPLAEVERYLTHICAALGYAHRQGIAHLDLKPENLLLHEDGRLVLADFGLAHLLKQGRLEAGTSASWGTPYYMAPEQIRGTPGPSSDLYALGVILYQLLTMQRPFTGATPEGVMMKHVLEAPPSLQAANPAAPATLEPVLQKALAKQPADRYPTADALLAAFRAVLGIPAPQPAQPPAPSAAPTIYMPPIAGPAPVAQPPSPTPQNTPQTAVAACEIPLPDRRLCGIPPVGRCATCGRAFCLTHQAREENYGRWYPRVDMCAPCFAQTPAEVVRAKQQAESHERVAKMLARDIERFRPIEEAREYFKSGAARNALLTAGVPTAAFYGIVNDQKPKQKRSLFGGGYTVFENVEVAIPIGRGWVLGEFTWKRKISSFTFEDAKILTALLDVPAKKLQDYSAPDESRPRLYLELLHDLLYDWPLARVYPCSGGYGCTGGRDYELQNFVEAMQAVKRLAGVPS